MPYEVVVMSERVVELAFGACITTRLEVNGTAAKVVTPGSLGIEYHRERVELAIDELSQPQVNR